MGHPTISRTLSLLPTSVGTPAVAPRSDTTASSTPSAGRASQPDEHDWRSRYLSLGPAVVSVVSATRKHPIAKLTVSADHMLSVRSTTDPVHVAAGLEFSETVELRVQSRFERPVASCLHVEATASSPFVLLLHHVIALVEATNEGGPSVGRRS